MILITDTGCENLLKLSISFKILFDLLPVSAYQAIDGILLYLAATFKVIWPERLCNTKQSLLYFNQHTLILTLTLTYDQMSVTSN